MNKIIIFIFVVILLASSIFIIYYFYEKPTVEENLNKTVYYDVAVKAMYKDSQEITNFIITLDESRDVYINSSTSSIGYVLAKIPENRTFKIYTSNIDNQKYYTSLFEYDKTTNENVRADIPLTFQGNLEINHTGQLDYDNPIWLILKSNGKIQYVSICMRWSSKIITAEIQNATMTEVPIRLTNKVDKCFLTKKSITNNTLIVPVYYKVFGSLTEYDYIEFYVLDGDIQYDMRDKANIYSIQSREGSDIGIPDMKYVIRY